MCILISKNCPHAQFEKADSCSGSFIQLEQRKKKKKKFQFRIVKIKYNFKSLTESIRFGNWFSTINLCLYTRLSVYASDTRVFDETSLRIYCSSYGAFFLSFCSFFKHGAHTTLLYSENAGLMQFKK